MTVIPLPRRPSLQPSIQAIASNPAGQAALKLGFVTEEEFDTGPDGNSHVIRGSVTGGELVKAESILFKETPAHSSFDWHNDPVPQYVITFAGVLEFTTKTGETVTIHPSEILLAVDHTGSGHKWRLVNDEPWKRAYVVFKEGADTHFVADQSVAQ